MRQRMLHTTSWAQYLFPSSHLNPSAWHQSPLFHYCLSGRKGTALSNLCADCLLFTKRNMPLLKIWFDLSSPTILSDWLRLKERWLSRISGVLLALSWWVAALSVRLYLWEPLQPLQHSGAPSIYTATNQAVTEDPFLALKFILSTALPLGFVPTMKMLRGIYDHLHMPRTHTIGMKCSFMHMESCVDWNV